MKTKKILIVSANYYMDISKNMECSAYNYLNKNVKNIYLQKTPLIVTVYFANPNAEDFTQFISI